MKRIVFFSALVSFLTSGPLFAEGEVTALSKPEETVTLSEEATAPLFERIRGAHLRAQQSGNVVATAATKE